MKHGVNSHTLESVDLLNSPAEIKDSIRSLYQVALEAEQLLIGNEQLAKELQRLSENYQRLEQLAQAGTWRTGQDNRIAFVNKRMAEMLGYSPDQMLGKNLLDSWLLRQGRKSLTT